MIIDTSAWIAILEQEAEAAALAKAIELASTRRVSTANALEAAMVIESRFGLEGGRDLDLLFARSRAELVPVTETQYEIARKAFREFGRGRHPAALNYGDCFAYALAKMTGEPLLFKGDDFAKTDIPSAL